MKHVVTTPGTCITEEPAFRCRGNEVSGTPVSVEKADK
jgi:hypothetical protein